MAKYKINKGFIIQKLANKITMFDGEESLLYSFNETASYVFSRLKLGWEKNKITGELPKVYAVTLEEARRDVENLIADLLSRKVITQITE